MNAPDRAAKVAAWIHSQRSLFDGEGDADAIRRRNLDPLIRYLNEADNGKWGKLIKRDRTPPHIPHDIIMWKDTLEHFDVFTGTERARDTQPAWGKNGAPANPNWVWLAVDDEPEPPPAPDDDTPELEALSLRVVEQDRRIAHLLQEQLKILARLKTLETAPAPAPLPDQEYVVEGVTDSTGGRFFGHQHSFRANVRKKP